MLQDESTVAADARWRYRPSALVQWPVNPPIAMPADVIEDIEEDRPERPRKRRSSARRAALEVLRDKARLEASSTTMLLSRLEALRRELASELGRSTDFRRFQLQRLVRDVDGMIGTATRAVQTEAVGAVKKAAELGVSHVDEPVRAADLSLVASGSGVDQVLVTSAYENTADLLTDSMQRFRSSVVSQVRRIALGVDTFAENMSTLATEIRDGGLDNPEYRAERILRTEVGRTFNASTFDRMADLADRMPFLRKGWAAVNDSRTRETHTAAAAVYVRGKGIKVRDLFAVGQAQMRFPVDPLASPAGRAAARETIMCRCTGFVDFDAQELARASIHRLRLAMSK